MYFFPNYFTKIVFCKASKTIIIVKNRLREKVTWYIRKRSYQRQKSAKPIQILPKEMVTWC